MNDNWCALCVAILCNLTIEQAFDRLENYRTKRSRTYNCLITEEDTQDMVIMRKSNMTYREIGQIYGLNDATVYRRIKRHLEEKACLNSQIA
jgi:DNA invertase Pin-like site-specific DNA recombinase